jgi:hypothetical protein
MKRKSSASLGVTPILSILVHGATRQNARIDV